MKKFYETPAVEFTGFNAEDVITTSLIGAINMAGTDAQAKFDASVAAAKNAGTINATVDFETYNW